MTQLPQPQLQPPPAQQQQQQRLQQRPPLLFPAHGRQTSMVQLTLTQHIMFFQETTIARQPVCKYVQPKIKNS